VAITKKIKGKKGGAGRGQGRLKLSSDKKCIQTPVYLPPDINKYVNEYKKITGDSKSTTIVILIDIARASLKNNKV